MVANAKWQEIEINTYSMIVPGGTLYRYAGNTMCFVPAREEPLAKLLTNYSPEMFAGGGPPPQPAIPSMQGTPCAIGVGTSGATSP